MKIDFFVPGTPKAQPRPRAFSRGGVTRIYNPGTAEGWKGLIALAAKRFRPARPMEGPIAVTIIFYLRRPKRLFRKKDPPGPIPYIARPDWDNLGKAVTDALTELSFWRDDALAWDVHVRKFYAAKDGETGARITIEGEDPPC